MTDDPRDSGSAAPDATYNLGLGELALVRKDSGGIFPDGTTNTPAPNALSDSGTAVRGEAVDEWGSDLDVAEWLVWYARRVHGKAGDVAKQALDENPALRFSERLAARSTASTGASEGLRSAAEDALALLSSAFVDAGRPEEPDATIDALRAALSASDEEPNDERG